MSTDFTIHPFKTDDVSPEMYAIMPSDDTNGFVVGEMDEVKALRSALDDLIERGQCGTEIDELDERLGWKWLNVGEARELAKSKGINTAVVTIRRACRLGAITGAQRDGRDWRMSQARFLAWLIKGNHKPGRRPAKDNGE